MKNENKTFQYAGYYIIVQENSTNNQILDFEMKKSKLPSMYMYSVINGYLSNDEIYDFIFNQSIKEYIKAYKDEFEWQVNRLFNKNKIIKNKGELLYDKT